MAISDEEQNIRRYDRQPPCERKANEVKDPRLVAIREKLRTEEGRKIYTKRGAQRWILFRGLTLSLLNLGHCQSQSFP